MIDTLDSPLILIVDDEIQTTTMISRIFEREGFRCHIAHDGMTGVEAAKRLIPDCILTDVQMPALNGFELLAALREDPLTANIPIIVVTSKARQPADIVHGLDLGADDFVQKPFDPRELMARTMSKIRSRKLEQALMRRTEELEQLVKQLSNEKLRIEQKTVFISYRRSTSKHLAQLIFQNLSRHQYDVFLDVNTLDGGPFDRIIENQIAARAHFILILSRGALARCVDEYDWLRREIEEAVRLDRNIIPIIDEGVNLEEELSSLPETMRNEIGRRNGIPYSHFYYEAAMDTLRERFLSKPVFVNISITPVDDLSEVHRRIERARDTSDSAKTSSTWIGESN